MDHIHKHNSQVTAAGYFEAHFLLNAHEYSVTTATFFMWVHPYLMSLVNVSRGKPTEPVALLLLFSSGRSFFRHLLEN